MTTPQFYFTVSAGRSGQASLAALLRVHRPDAYVAFEEPQVNPSLPGMLGDLERHWRRRFVETDELLGRGQVLKAYERGDQRALEVYGARRMRWIERQLAATGAAIYIDISKHFAHGLHTVICDAVSAFALVRLVRDPLDNMRSYLNRGKRFAKDNNNPAALCNELVMPGTLSEGECYLWAWAEAYLRFDAICERFEPHSSRTIRTEELSQEQKMTEHLQALRLLNGPITPPPPQNTNSERGLPGTQRTEEDVRCFEGFVARLPDTVRARLDYLDDYDPWKGYERG